ncbi:hypothetical protein [Leucobacter sp. gxy201]|uniref:hypothetical protein n=1 Tax=Leucobacter sp. gxy201 TaxID=2957200 RepID=UPI003DA09465
MQAITQRLLIGFDPLRAVLLALLLPARWNERQKPGNGEQDGQQQVLKDHRPVQLGAQNEKHYPRTDCEYEEEYPQDEKQRPNWVDRDLQKKRHQNDNDGNCED